MSQQQQNIPPPVANTREAFQAALHSPENIQPLSKSKEWLQKIVLSSVGQGVIGGLFILIFLYFFNPPIVQSKSETDIEKPTRDMKKILIWSTITTILIITIPIGLNLWKKRSQSQ